MVALLATMFIVRSFCLVCLSRSHVTDRPSPPGQWFVIYEYLLLEGRFNKGKLGPSHVPWESLGQKVQLQYAHGNAHRYILAYLKTERNVT